MPARGWSFPNPKQTSIAALRLEIRAIRQEEKILMERRIERRTHPLLAELAELTASQSLLKKRKLSLSAARAQLGGIAI